MNKLSSIFSLVLAVVLMAPSTFAHNVVKKDAEIKGAEMHFDQKTLKGEFKVCNDNNEREIVRIEVKNMKTNGVYSKQVKVDANKCQTHSLKTGKSFSLMSMEGDQIKVGIKQAKRTSGYKTFRYLDEKFIYIGEERNENGCLYVDGDVSDGIYSICENDIINHKSGIRIHVIKSDRDRAVLMINGFPWGGNRAVILRKGSERTIYVGRAPYKEVALKSMLTEKPNPILTLRIERES